MFTKIIATKIIIQLKEITKLNVFLYDEKGNLLAASKKKDDFNAKKMPLFFYTMHLGYFSVEKNEDEQTDKFIQSIIEMAFGQFILLQEDTYIRKLQEAFFSKIHLTNIQLNDVKEIEQYLGTLLNPPFQFVVGKINGSKALLLTLLNHYFNDKNYLYSIINENEFILLCINASSKYIENKLTELCFALKHKNITYQIGTSQVVTVYTHLQKALFEAFEAIKKSNNNIVTFKSIMLESLLESSSIQKREEFIIDVLNDLPEKYYETIEMFCKYNLQLADCSKAMYIHRNSLIYRLKRIKEITNLDPQNANHLFSLQLALKIKKSIS